MLSTPYSKKRMHEKKNELEEAQRQKRAAWKRVRVYALTAADPAGIQPTVPPRALCKEASVHFVCG